MPELVYPLNPPSGNPTVKDFFEVALRLALNKVPSEACLEAWIIMATLENSKAYWNPADTTQPEDGAHPFNSFGPGGSFHVWNYITAEQGISAFQKTIGGPEYAGLRSVLDNEAATKEQCLEAIATSPWTGIVGNPHIYDGIAPEPNRLVEGPGGWPYTLTAPEPEPKPEPAPAAPPTEDLAEEVAAAKKAGTNPEVPKVESAIDAEVAAERELTENKPVDHAAVKAKLAQLETHFAELKDLIG